MILSGPAIDNCVKNGKIEITPYDPKYLNPASIDLTLGRDVAVYDRCVWTEDTGYHRRAVGCKSNVLDSKVKPVIEHLYVDEELGLDLQPGILYLMHTVERVYTESFVPILDGKSSIARLGIMVHLTAGFGDPGYRGQYTLEVTCVHPVRVYQGMRFCQMRFHHLSELQGQHMSYQDRGHYVGEASEGPVPSMAYKQFEQ